MLAFGNSFNGEIVFGVVVFVVVVVVVLFGDCCCEAWFLLGGLVHRRVRTHSWLIPALNLPFLRVISPCPDRLLGYGSETRRFTVNDYFC